MHNFPNILRTRRRNMGINTIVMAEALGISASTIYKFEKGSHHISLDAFQKMCNYLGLDVTLTLNHNKTKQ